MSTTFQVKENRRLRIERQLAKTNCLALGIIWDAQSKASASPMTSGTLASTSFASSPNMLTWKGAWLCVCVSVVASSRNCMAV